MSMVTVPIVTRAWFDALNAALLSAALVEEILAAFRASSSSPSPRCSCEDNKPKDLSTCILSTVREDFDAFIPDLSSIVSNNFTEALPI